MTDLNRRIVLAQRPTGWPQETDFRLEEAPVPEPGEGEILVRGRYLSLDPYMRGRMNAGASYAPGVALDDVMVGGAVGDDTELYQNFVDLAFFEEDGVAAQFRDAAARLDHLAQLTTMVEGINRRTMDPLHAYEEGLNQEALMAVLEES